MILRDQASTRASTPVLISAGLLAILALPGWSASKSPDQKPQESGATATRASADAVPAAPADKADERAADADEESDDDADKAVDEPRRGRDTRTIRSRAAGSSDRPGKSSAEELYEFFYEDQSEADRRPSRIRSEAADTADRPRREAPSRTIQPRTIERRDVRDRPSAEVRNRQSEMLLRQRLGEDTRLSERRAGLDKSLFGRRPGADTRPAEIRPRAEESLFRRRPGADSRPRAEADSNRQNKPSSDDPEALRQTRSRRISEMRALINQLQDQLKALEDEGRDDGSK